MSRVPGGVNLFRPETAVFDVRHNMDMDQFDKRSFDFGRMLGAIGAWCEAARTGAKGMSLSSPFEPGDHDLLASHVEEVTGRNEVKYHLEKELMTTDLFAEIDMTGLWVFIIYRDDETLEGYLALKEKKARLEKAGEYVGEARHEIAMAMGRLLGYSEVYAAQRIERVKSARKG